MTLPKSKIQKADFLDSIPQYFTAFRSEGNTSFGSYRNGYLGNLKVKVTESAVSIRDSSLCKYFLANNFKTLGKGDTKLAIEKISDHLHLPFHLANVTRIDFAQNFIMQYQESLYYSYLGENRHYQRLPQNNGLYFSNKLRQLLFYGKVHEQKQKKQQIPEIYQNRHVLRYELRFKKRLREQFKRHEITAGLLYDEVFYKELVEKWKNEYLSIQKINSKLSRMNPTGSTKELIENMALFQLLQLGQSNVLATIKEWQGRGIITKKQAKDHREKIKKLASTPINENGNNLIEELNKKVNDASRYY